MAATVLVIDDDALVRDSISAYLEDCDYVMLTAASAAAGLDLLDETQVDAVICDLKMPGMSGIELLALVKARHPKLPVIVVSGAGVMEDVVQALRLGADDYLVKPILDLAVLSHALRKALQRTQLEQENRAYREYLEKTNGELKRGLGELRADQQAGRQAQLRMLPEPLDFHGLHCNHSITPSLLLSGDFLDYFPLDDDRLAFYIADVSGHGASSAFVTVLLKNVTYRLKRNFRRGSSDDVIHPAQVLQRINAELHASELDKHLTMFYGLICRKTNTLYYSVGGHFPMPVMLTPGNIQYLQGRAMPVGLFREAEYEEYRIPLEQDFALLLFSDGILEIMPEPTLNNKEDALLAAAVESKGDIFRLAEALGVSDKAEVPDDIAMVSIARGAL